MQNATVRERQFNMRMSEEEWERLTRLAAQRGVSTPDLVRWLLEKADEQPSRAPRLTPFSRDVLAALGRSKTSPTRTLDLIDPVAARGYEDPWLGSQIQQALVDLGSRGFVHRVSAPNGTWEITDEGREELKRR